VKPPRPRSKTCTTTSIAQKSTQTRYNKKEVARRTGVIEYEAGEEEINTDITGRAINQRAQGLAKSSVVYIQK